MTDPAKSARRARHDVIRAQVADEEIEAEVAESAAALDVSLHLRISQSLDTELRRQAAAEHIPTSALVRRLPTQAVHRRDSGSLTSTEVEAIASRVAREELQRS